MGKFSSNGPSQSEIIAKQEAAAKKERERIKMETAEKEAERDQKMQASIAERSNKRRQFATGIAGAEDDDENRRKFLKGV